MSAWHMDAELVGRTHDGEMITHYTLSHNGLVRATFSNFGASLVSLVTPDRHGERSNIALTLASAKDYWDPARNTHALGATLGRFSRCVPHGRLQLDGCLYSLSINEACHHFHGGPTGFSRRVWRATGSSVSEPAIHFFLESPDSDQGYPGNLQAKVTYAFPSWDTLSITYDVSCDRTTLAGLCNHTYWNLAGTDDVNGHLLEVAADFIVGADADHLPDGSFVSVAGSTLDFRQETHIGATRIDHCFCVQSGHRQARLRHPPTGRYLDIVTDQPALAVHTGDSLPLPRQGIALQTTALPYYPKIPFNDAILPAGTSRRHSTVYKFGCFV